MAVQLSTQVSEHLARYYLDEASAERFRALIDRAEELLSMPDFSARPLAAQGIAHIVREALKEISNAVKDPDRGRFDVLGRAVVKSRIQLDAVPPTERADALTSLIVAIDELGQFFSTNKRVHERGLVNLIAHTTGATIAPDTAAQYQKVASSLARSAHNSATIEEVETQYSTAVELLERIFDYSGPRLNQLEELATIASPTEDDSAKAIALITNSYELRLFLSLISTPDWLWRMGHNDLLRPTRTEASWSIRMLCDRLGSSQSAELARWLERATVEWGSSQGDAEQIASAAKALRGEGNGLLLKLLRRYPDSDHIRREVQAAVQQSAPDEQFVENAFLALGGTG